MAAKKMSEKSAVAEGKWISGLTSQMSLREAAQKVVPARLLVVVHYLPLAVEAAAHDVEHVHQLRVASRRAVAAVQLFRSCLADKCGRQLRKSLRAIRRSAGDARDWDVFFSTLASAPAFASLEARPARDLLFGIAAARRMSAQDLLVEIAQQAGKKFENDVHDIIQSSFDWQQGDHPSLGELARQMINALVHEIDERTSPPPETYEQLHELRILGKRLRYSLEIFADCFGPFLREHLYPAIEDMQEILGEITDAHVMADRIGRIRDHMSAYHRADWPHYRKAVGLFSRAQQQVLPRQRKRFLAWLPNWKSLWEQFGSEFAIAQGRPS